MEMIEGVVRNYDWGTTSEIPSLLGRPADGRPWAELWFGAHPSAPALVGLDARPLDQIISADPPGSLGAEVAEEFGGLPFLLKILSAGAPLSLQVHPSISQAVAGFEKENAAGLELNAANRSFRDQNHKPELICALTEFEVLSGFRDPDESLRLFETVASSRLDPVRAELAGGGDGCLQRVLEWLLTLSAPDARLLSSEVAAACHSDVEAACEFSIDRRMAVDLADRYPGDVGVVIALMLNHVCLDPGEALFLGAGNLHAYLGGTGVEIMANSDNVLRCGLTPKHVDASTLLDVVDATPTDLAVQAPAPGSPVHVYESPVREFSLTRFSVDGTADLGEGPAVLMCLDGHVDVGVLTLHRGSAAWVPARDGQVTASGHGTLFRAGVGRSV